MNSLVVVLVMEVAMAEEKAFRLIKDEFLKEMRLVASLSLSSLRFVLPLLVLCLIFSSAKPHFTPLYNLQMANQLRPHMMKLNECHHPLCWIVTKYFDVSV